MAYGGEKDRNHSCDLQWQHELQMSTQTLTGVDMALCRNLGLDITMTLGGHQAAHISLFLITFTSSVPPLPIAVNSFLHRIFAQHSDVCESLQPAQAMRA